MTNRQARARAAADRAYDRVMIGSHNYGRIEAWAASDAAYDKAYERKTSQAHDLFGSNARRAMQAEKDAKEIAEPVAATPAGTGRLNLRPIAERVARRAGEDR